MPEILSIGELLDLGGSASTAGLIPYSALEYSAQVITGISGSAIGGQGGTDSATVSAIASAYAESAASGKLDNSASGLWYPIEGNPSGFITGVDLSPYAYASSVSSKVDQSAFDQCCSSMSSVVSSLETSVTSMSSVVSGLTGDYMEKSASSMFQPSGNYQTAGNYMSASESSAFYPMTGNPSGFLTEHQSLTAYQDRSSISAWTGDMSSISAKLDQSAFTAYTATANPKIYTGVSPVVVDNVNDQISLSATAVHMDSSMTAYMSGGSGFIGVNADFGEFVHTADMSGYIPTGESSKYQLTANMGGYIPTSESSKYYSTSNPSSFATTAQVAEKLDISSQVVTSVGSSVAPGLEHVFTGINGSAIYAPSATYAASANAASLADQYIVHYSVESSERYDISALRFDKLDVTAQVVSSTGTGTYSGSSVVNKINGSAISAAYADSASRAHNSYSAAAAISAERYFYSVGVENSSEPISALRVQISSKLDASASSDFYSTSNPSGFLTASYSPTFGYDDGKISSIDGSALAGGGGVTYTSPSGTLAIDNDNDTIDAWNSSMRVDEHITAASSSPGTAQQVYTSTYQYSAIWTGTTIPGDIVNVSAYCYLEYINDYSASAFGVKAGGGTSKLTEFFCEREGYNPYTASGSASVTLDDTYTSIYMIVSSQYNVPSTGQWVSSISGIANVERPAQTASSTSVYEQVLKDSTWNSLTAWAASQGWTP